MKMIYSLLFVSGLLLLDPASSQAETKEARDTSIAWPVASQDVVWDSPSTDAKGCMPLGNGDIGLNVWVEASGDTSIRVWVDANHPIAQVDLILFTYVQNLSLCKFSV